MNDLPNLDALDDLQRGVEPEPKRPQPADVGTAARRLLPLLNIPGVVTADRLEATQ